MNLKFFATKVIIWLWLWLWLWTGLSAQAETLGAEKYDLYYLTVGSGHYRMKEKNRPEAVNSARQMTAMLVKMGGKGEELLSLPDTESAPVPITKTALLGKIDAVKRLILKGQPKNPLLVFYYMGHGIGNDVSHFITFGDYDFNMQRFSDYRNTFNFDSLLNTDELAMNFYTFDLNGDTNFSRPNKPFFDKSFVRQIVAAFPGATGIPNTQIHPRVKKEKQEIAKQFGVEVDGKAFLMGSQTTDSTVGTVSKIDASSLEKMMQHPLLQAMANQKQFNGGGSLDKGKLKELRQKLKIEGETLKKNASPGIVASNKNAHHVPYFVILDSCSDGITDFGENLLENRELTKTDLDSQTDQDLTNFKEKINQNIKEIKNNPKWDKEYKAVLIQQQESILAGGIHNIAYGKQYAKESIDNQIIASGLVGQMIAGSIRADTFKKYGALFFAANPGEKTTAYTPSFDPSNLASLPKNTDKVGKLAKRFELALGQALNSPHNVSFGDFIDFFSATEPGSDQTGGIATISKPYSWFDLDENIRTPLLLEN